MQAASLRELHKKDNILIKLARPLEIGISVAIFLAIVIVLIIGIVDIFNLLDTQKAFQEINNNIDENNVSGTAQDQLNKINEMLGNVYSYIGSTIKIFFKTIFILIIVFIVSRIIANGVLLLTELYDYKKWTNDKDLLIKNIIKRVLLAIFWMIIAVGFSGIKDLLNDEIYKHLNDIYNNIPATLDKLKAIADNGINSVEELKKQVEPIIQDFQNKIEPSLNAIQNLFESDKFEEIKDSLITDSVLVGVGGLFHAITVIVLCTITKTASKTIKVSENVSVSKEEKK